MPLGGANILWDENSPPDGESAGLGNERIQSVKTSVRNAAGSEHNWPSTGGPDSGYHLFGSARPFYGTQSRVSSSGTDGRLMLTSDTSRLFAVGSGGSVFLGGFGVLSVLSAMVNTSIAPTQVAVGPAVTQREHWTVDLSRGTTDQEAKINITFPQGGYNGVPFVFVTSSETELSTRTIPVVTSVQLITNTVMQVRTLLSDNPGTSEAGPVSNASAPYRWVHVISIGTRTF